MNRRVRAAIALGSIALACDSPTAIDPNDVSGLWMLTFVEQAECGSVVDLDLVQLRIWVANDGVTNSHLTQWSVSSWAPATGRLDGDELQLDLWFGNAAIRLEGTVTASGTFTGTARDPSPGHPPMYTLGVCLYTVTGEKLL